MISPGALLLGLLLAAPALWAALREGTVAADVAMQRLVLILIATTIAWATLQALVNGFVRSVSKNDRDETAPARRRSSDQ